MSSTPDNYTETVPEDVDMSQEEWLELDYHTQYYHSNEWRQDQVRKNQNKRREEKKEWLNDKKEEEGCFNCGIDNPICLDFHHIDNKNYNLSRMAANDASYDKMRSEIEKCVVVCANCHRKLRWLNRD